MEVEAWALDPEAVDLEGLPTAAEDAPRPRALVEDPLGGIMYNSSSASRGKVSL